MNSQLQKEMRDLFDTLKVGKTKVQRTSLISLLEYHQLDIEMPEFYRYIRRSLQKLPDSNVREEDFLKILMNPDIDLANSSKEEMADVFSILDTEKEGSIDMNNFVELYKKSENYLCLSESQQKDVIDEIREAFYCASEDGKINPMSFYSIVKFRSA